MTTINAVPRQEEIDVYLSASGSIIIAQPDGMDEPNLVAIAPIHVESVIRALRQIKRQALEAPPHGD
ncbi:MAG: hypothetical protein V4639_03350 [Pseudomonadota bacterium]